MDAGNLHKKLCKGAGTSEDDDGFRAIEKVLAPFLRTLKKRKHERADVLPPDDEELYLKKDTKDLLDKLQNGFGDPLKLRTLLNETAELLKVVTKSKSVNLYLADYDSGELLLCQKYVKSHRLQRKYAIESGTYLAAYVAHSKEYVISSDILGDVRFPQGIPEVPVVKSVICLPIMTNSEGNCIGVIELYRQCSERPYDLIDLQICNALMAWMGIAIEQNGAKQALMKEIEIQRQLSVLADMYFSGIISFNKIVSDFIKVSKSAVNAERGAFYVFREPVQHNSDEAIWADAFEEGADEYGETILYKKRDRQKFTKNKPGIPGYAARSGEIIIIPDAYKDYRFDRKSDSPFYRTRSVVAIPIKNDTGVLGVLLLINSMTSPYFRYEDIVLVQSFSCCFNLICGYYFLETCYTKAQLRLSSKDRLLDFYSKPSQEEINTFKLTIQSETLPQAFSRLDWDPAGFEDDALKFVGIALYHLQVESSIQSKFLADFLLRVKKSHRPLSYHSFEHGLSVFHFTYYILNKNKNIFTTAEVVAMLLAALCHDVDHMGVTNSFLTLKNDTVYKLYGEFCGEAHRFDVFQLLVTHSELFSELPEQKSQILCKMIKKLFLAFDLAVYFQNRQKIITCLNSNSFSLDDPEHRYYAQIMILICADHNADFKSFNLARKSAANLARELHRQGDLEKSMGFTPLPMLDRTKHEMIPEHQWIFLKIVVMPCVEILVAVFPNLSMLEDLLNETILKWDELVTLRGREIWKINQAIGIERTTRRLNHRVTLTSTLSSLKTVSSDTRSERL